MVNLLAGEEAQIATLVCALTGHIVRQAGPWPPYSTTEPFPT